VGLLRLPAQHFGAPSPPRHKRDQDMNSPR
jgi:hypothetical protein